MKKLPGKQKSAAGSSKAQQQTQPPPVLEADISPEVHMEGASNLLALDLRMTRDKLRELLQALEEKKRLIELLDRYGEKALRQAVHEAIERNTPRASSVAFLLRQRHRSAPLPLDLSRYPLAQDVHVRSHDLETYDELARNRDKESKS